MSISSTSSSIRASASPERIAQLRYHLRHHPLVLVGLVVVVGWILVAILATEIATHDPLAQDVSQRLDEPGENGHLWGADALGRDIQTRVLYGARITIPAGIAVIIFGSIIGILMGSLAGWLGGLWDELLMRITELFMAFPTIILAMAITAALGRDIRNAIIALVIVWWPSYARLIRGIVLEIKHNEYVDAARCAGATGPWILFRTILPNAIAPAIVLMTLDIGNAILTFAGLSFLGLGPPPTSPEWGSMVNAGLDNFSQWWMWLFPGMSIASLVMAFNFIGDGIRDIFDPRLRRD